MRITINLLLKKTKKTINGTHPIYARCTMNGKRIELSSGIFIEQKAWDNSNQQINHKHPNVKVVNNKLNRFLADISDIYYQLEALGEDFDVFSIKERFLGSPQHQLVKTFKLVLSSIEKKVGHGYAYGTFKHYKTTFNRLLLFLNENYSSKDIPLSKINYNFINSFDTYLRVIHHVGPNTIGRYHKQLKKVLNDALAMNLLDKNPYINFKVKRYQGNRDYLTLEEVNLIENKPFEIDRVKIVRDIFIFACYTGLSYSDIARLNENHISLGDDGEKWIIIDRNKTDNRCRIPLLPKAKKIIDRYRDFPTNSSNEKLLPVNSNQKMNTYLKEIADVCSINKNLTMHVARHTFATSITLANGVPIETVSKMLGHTSIKTTQIYGRIIDSKISNDMKKLKDILG